VTDSTTAVPARAAGAEPPARSVPGKLFAVLPAIGIAFAVLTFYFVEGWTRKTPWVFTDELEWSQISRAIASTGHAARRGQPIFFKSLYAWVIAPAWWIHSTASAYAAVKYVNAVVMSLASVPTYFLARMYVSRGAAVAVAVLSVAIPGMAYAAAIVPEVLAYPWYATCSWLIVRCLVRRGKLDYALACGACVVAGLVRWPQFATVPAAFLIALGALWVIGPRGRSFRAGWSRADHFAAIVLFAGVLILFNRVILQHEQIWQVSTQYWKNRMVDLGLEAGLAFTVGMGILPIIGGFTSLFLRERRGDPRYRAYVAYFASSILCIVLYTAIKAAYLSTIFATLVEERNMIYLSPLMLLGTAMVFEAKRIDWRVVAVVSAFVVWLVYAKNFQLLFPYFEAPGFAILAVFTRHFSWTVETLRLGLVLTLVVGLIALRMRKLPAVAAATALLVGAWMLTSEIATTVGSDNYASQFRANLPAHLDWIDQRVHGAPVTYLGQEIKDPNGLFLTEFWNRSIKHVDSLDGSAPGPGPTYAPNIVAADGKLDGLDGVPYIVADNGVTLQAPVVKDGRWKQLTLYRAHGPWRLLQAEQQVFSDGWAPEWSTYTYFKPGLRGTLEVTLSRTGYHGTAPAGRAVLTTGTVTLVNQQARLDKITDRRRVIVENGSYQVVKIPVERTPVRTVLTFRKTIPPTASDPRNLGAQVAFRFVPAKRQG
jgi:hypothetical protein